MRHFNCRFELHLPGFEEFAVNGVPFQLKVSFRVERVRELIPHDVDSLPQIALETIDRETGVFSRCVGVKLGPDAFDFQLQLFPGSSASAFEIQVF
jgi:hypothetical protein